MSHSHYQEYRSLAHFYIRRWQEINTISQLTDIQREAVVSFYANERNEWEIENGWLVKIGFCIGIISVPLLLVGILILYPVYKWKEREEHNILERTFEKAKALSDSNLGNEPID
jgi:hypothetical protein